MSEPPIVVVKAGGSVLRCADDYERVAGVLHGHVRAGRRVVAVVSARAGRTSRLLAQAGTFVRQANAGAIARHVAVGEHASAARLELTCVRAGLDVFGLDAQALGIEVSSADHVAWSADRARRLRAASDRHDVVVVPGFVACDATTGALTTLGRGGSDLTAFVVASTLRDLDPRRSVTVELVKDVDGLFETDPHRDARARAFARATYADVARHGGGVVQRRALDWARDHGLEFDLRAPTTTGGTRVGDGPSLVRRDSTPTAPLRVAVVGCGVVGTAVLRALTRSRGRFTPVAVLVRSTTKPRAADLPDVPVESDAARWATHDADVVVDVANGTSYVERLADALRHGRHVVTANKAMAARHGVELAALAARHRVTFATSACVGGAAPMLEAIGRARRSIVALEGIVNATSTVVLDALARGESLADAVDAARRLGLAEADASRDLDGVDAAEKLVLLLRAAGLPEPALDAIPREPIDATTVDRARAAARDGARLRQVVTWSSAGPRVHLAAVGPDHRLASCVDAHVALAIDEGGGPRIVARGLGAGPHPTTTAILADLEDLVSRTDAADSAQHPGVAGVGSTPVASS